MAPKDLLGLLLLVAAFTPGYVYIHVAEKRHTRPARSGVVETVELVAIGAVISTVAVLLVLALGGIDDAFDARRLLKDASAYVSVEPIRCLTALLATVLVVYGLAAIAAMVLNRKVDYKAHESEGVVPGRTVWQQLLRSGPSRPGDLVLNVELRDGRILTGLAYSWTATDADNRELALQRAPHAPILMRAAACAQAQEINDDFVLLREADVLAVYGRRATPRSS